MATESTFASIAMLTGVREEMVVLPSLRTSGMKVKLRCPDLVDMILADGEVIDLLTPVVMSAGQNVGGTTAAGNLGVVFDLVKQIPALLPKVNAVVAATIVEPRLSTDPTSEAYVGKLPAQDRFFVLSWALGKEFGNLQAMFQQAGVGAATAPNSAGIRAAS